MKCLSVKKDLALFAGDDLPRRKKRALESHLETCPTCAGELESLKNARKRIQKIARYDQPGTLLPDFPEKIARSIADAQENSRQGGVSLLRLLRQQPAAAAGIFILGIILGAAALFIFDSSKKVASDQLLREILSAKIQGDPELARDPDHIFFRAFDGPYRLDKWEAPRQSGVFAILHRTNMGDGAESYVIDYCGQGWNLSLYQGYPWIHHRLKHLIAHTGSPENIYIAVFLMPDSSKTERLQVEKALVKTFNPIFNRGV